MAGRQAKVLTPTELDALLEHVRGRRDSLRSRVIILLSVRAGLRAAEVAKLEWRMVMGASGKVGHTIELEDRIAKKNWDFEFDTSKKNFKKLKKRVLYWIEKKTGKRLFDYRNYKII